MITENLTKIKSTLPEGVQLVAVSKTKSEEEIKEAYTAGQRIFGENYVQELVEKAADLPQDIQWHMIGHLQSNKVKYIAPFVSLIHGVHSFKLLKEINKRAKNENRIIDILLQFHIAEEETKSGFTLDEAKEALESETFEKANNIRVCGVMGMATFTDDKEQVRKEFKEINNYFQLLKKQFFNSNDDFTTISMGMSGDYNLAIEEGSNMVRVGSAIFGARNYN